MATEPNRENNSTVGWILIAWITLSHITFLSLYSSDHKWELSPKNAAESLLKELQVYVRKTPSSAQTTFNINGL